MTATLVVARLTFQEAARRRVLLAAVVLGLLFLVVYGVGFTLIRNELVMERNNSSGRPQADVREVYNWILMIGLYAINFLTVMMTVLTSVDTLSGEIISGTMHTLAAKPVRRWEILLGKWLGFAGMLTLYLLFMAGGVMVIGYLSAGYVMPGALRGLALMWLNVLMLLSLSLLGGATLSTLANGVLVFGMYGVAFVGGWIELIGFFVGNQTAVNLGRLATLLLPSEALWKRAAYEMRSPLLSGIFGNPFTAGPVPSTLMIVYAVAYMVVALLLAMRQFNRRDL